MSECRARSMFVTLGHQGWRVFLQGSPFDDIRLDGSRLVEFGHSPDTTARLSTADSLFESTTR